MKYLYHIDYEWKWESGLLECGFREFAQNVEGDTTYYYTKTYWLTSGDAYHDKCSNEEWAESFLWCYLERYHLENLLDDYFYYGKVRGANAEKLRKFLAE